MDRYMYVNAIKVGTEYAEEDNAISCSYSYISSFTFSLSHPPLILYLPLPPSLLTLQCNDFRGRVHDCRVSSDGSSRSDWISRVSEIDDNHLGRLSDLLTDTDEFI